MNPGCMLLALFPLWLSLAAGGDTVRAEDAEDKRPLYLYCAWRGKTGLVPPAVRTAFCRRVARRIGAVPASGRQWAAFAAKGGNVRLARLELQILGTASLKWAFSEGTAGSMHAAPTSRCGPYRVHARDAGLKAALRQVIRSIGQCRR